MTHYYFIGIGGTGLSPIARVLTEQGHQVSGSDLNFSPMAKELQEMGVKVTIGHDAANITGVDMIIRSSAVPDSNVEVIAGRNAHIPVLKRSEFLPLLIGKKDTIAVAGTHGKTTTTAMIALCLMDAGLDPSFVIGGVSKNLGTNAHSGKGKYFVIEADEYDRMFLGLNPKILVVTHIEYDHPDCFRSKEEYFKAFIDLAKSIKESGTLLACSDNEGTQKLIRSLQNHVKILSYGRNKESDYQIREINQIAGDGINFCLKSQGFESVVNLPIPGNHNAYNAAAAIAVAHLIGLSHEQAVNSLRKYEGAVRRFDLLGETQGITIINDYAHHPTEIRATLSAARCRYPDRSIWAVWQPHTYSRTQQLMEGFKDAFSEANHVIVTEIYGSREKRQDYSSVEVVKRMHHSDVRHIADLKAATNYLINHMKSGDVLIVMSAGDADCISREVLNHLQARGKRDSS